MSDFFIQIFRNRNGIEKKLDQVKKEWGSKKWKFFMTLAVRRRTGVEEGQEKRKKEKERARDWYQNGSTTKISFTL